MAENRRPDRVSEAIREEVATFLAQGAKDPRIVAFVTVTGAEITRDLRHAKVYVSIFGTDEEKTKTMEGLRSTATHLRSRVGRALRLRVAPEIHFTADESIARASRVEELLAQVKDDLAPRPDEAVEGDATAPEDRAADGAAESGDDTSR